APAEVVLQPLHHARIRMRAHARPRALEQAPRIMQRRLVALAARARRRRRRLLFLRRALAQALHVAEREGAAHELAAGQVGIDRRRRRLRDRIGTVAGADARRAALEAVEEPERARVDAGEREQQRDRHAHRALQRRPEVERLAAVVAERDAPPLAADEVRLVRSPVRARRRPAEVVTARLAEAPEAEHERADDDREAADEQERAPAAALEALGREHAEAGRGDDAGGEQRQRHQGLGADHGSTLARLTSLSSMVMRRFFDLASRTAACSAALSVPENAGTSSAGVLSACVQMTTWSGTSLPYFAISR